MGQHIKRLLGHLTPSSKGIVTQCQTFCLFEFLGYDNSGNYDDDSSLYENFGFDDDIAEDGSLQKVEENIIEEKQEELTLDQCCEKALNSSQNENCKALAMNLTDMDASTECVFAYYNCCLHHQEQLKADGNGQNDALRHFGMSHSHMSRSRKVYYKHYNRIRPQHKLKRKYSTMRLFKGRYKGWTCAYRETCIYTKIWSHA